jgi:transglutaminase-like putative cysteine protease
VARKRLIVWSSVVGVALILTLVVLLAPLQSAQFVRGSFNALPKGARDLVPQSMQQDISQSLDDMVRNIAGDKPEVLIRLGISLVSTEVPEGGWTSRAQFNLSWTDLNNAGIAYEVRRGSSAAEAGAVLLVRTPEPRAQVDLPGDGLWWIKVVPMAGAKAGKASTFGPFGRDATPPGAPVLAPVPDVKGYTFSLNWSTGSAPASGISHFQVERRPESGVFAIVGNTTSNVYVEDQLGNGAYVYRVRAVSGASVASAASNEVTVRVTATMTNPGSGARTYGVHANYTSFMHLWDLSDPSVYLTLDDLAKPEHQAAKNQYLGKEWGIDTDNQTLIGITQSVVGGERNTFKIAERLFLWLYETTDYDHDKASSGNQELFRAGQTLDAKGGICGDLAVLYLTVLRIAGVPARPVHGYLDNPSAGLGDFHMWVEVYVGGDPNQPWMTVDVSGASSPSETGLWLFFGIFNPDYLSLGTESVYDPPTATTASWNAWARLSWSCQGGSCPSFMQADGTPADVEVIDGFLVVNKATRERQLQVKTGDQPAIPSSWNCANSNCVFFNVHTKTIKRIDFGATISSIPANLKSVEVEIRFPQADGYAAMNAYQSVIYTVYKQRGTVTLGSDGFATFKDTF